MSTPAGLTANVTGVVRYHELYTTYRHASGCWARMHHAACSLSKAGYVMAEVVQTQRSSLADGLDTTHRPTVR